MSPGCAEIEALLAARLVAGGEPDAEVTAHLEACDACMRLVRELENPVVAGALEDLVEAAALPLDLTVVPREHYVRGKEIGRGGMGRIIRAQDRRLGRRVAIKELLDERLRPRFEREARLTARLTHPSIVSVHEVGCWPDGKPFYAMKYIAGRPLDQAIDAARSLAERLALLPHFISAADAIAYAHSERVIHRDLKPHNILIGAFGETVVIDWGLAKELGTDELPSAGAPFRDGEPAWTKLGAGTPAYMPPEQGRGEPPDERVDVYALGATLYHLVTGVSPPPAETAAGSLRRLVPLAPPELSTVVEKAMAPDREDRYRSARQLAEELRRFQNGQLVGAHRYSAGVLVRRWLRRRRLALAATFAFLASLAAVGAVSFQRVLGARREAEAQRDQARRSYGEVMLERGRQQLLDGAAARALASLREAAAQGLDTPSLRFLLGEARRSTAPLLLTLEPTGRVAAATLSPDGALVAVAVQTSHKTMVEVWEVGQRRLRCKLEVDEARDLAFDATGRRLIVLASSVEVHDTVSGAKLWTAPDLGAAFSPDGSLVVTWKGDLATIWSRDGDLHFEMQTEGSLERAAFRPDGRAVMLVGRGEGSLRDVTTGEELLALPGGEDGGFDERGELMFGSRYDQIVVRDQAGALLRRITVDEAGASLIGAENAAGFLDGGRRLAGTLTSGQLVIWPLRHAADGSWPAPTVVVLGPAMITSCWPLPDGSGVVIGGNDGVTRTFHADGRAGETFEGHGSIAGVMTDRAGRRLLTMEGTAAVKVWQLGLGEPALLPPAVTAARFDDRGRLLVLGASAARVFDAATGRLVAMRALAGTPPRGDLAADAVAFVDGSRWSLASDVVTPAPRPPAGFLAVHAERGLAVVVRPGLVPALVELGTGRRLHELPDSGGVVSLAFSPRGDRIALAHSARRVALWDTASGEKLATIGDVRAQTVRFDASGTALIVREWGGGLEIIDLHTLEVLWASPPEVTAASGDRHGLMLVGTAHGTATLRDGQTGSLLRSYTLPDGPVVVAELAADGRHAVLATPRTTWLLDLTPERQERPPPAGEAVCPPGTRPVGGPASRLAWCARADDTPEGAEVTYAADGRLRELRAWVDGEPRRLVTFHDSGLPRAAGPLGKDGLPDGEWRSWYEDGRPMSAGPCASGMRFGTWQHWSRDGATHAELFYGDRPERPWPDLVECPR